jgi:hypothetical protein
MYSSVLDGIILDPSMMVIPIDDHMVHRGHGVFDTATISDGFVQYHIRLSIFTTMTLPSSPLLIPMIQCTPV